MGSSTSQETDINQTIVNNVLQTSNEECLVTCQNDIDDTTVIISDSSDVTVNISQLCTISNVDCIMNTNLDSLIDNTLEGYSEQEAGGSGGFHVGWTGMSLAWDTIDQNTDINQYISNSITQTMTSACDISGENTTTDSYFSVTDSDNVAIGISQEVELESSNCNMDNSAKSTTYTTEIADASQSAGRCTSAGGCGCLVFILIIVGFILLLVVMMSGMASINKTSSATTQSAANANSTANTTAKAADYYGGRTTAVIDDSDSESESGVGNKINQGLDTALVAQGQYQDTKGLYQEVKEALPKSTGVVAEAEEGAAALAPEAEVLAPLALAAV